MRNWEVGELRQEYDKLLKENDELRLEKKYLLLKIDELNKWLDRETKVKH